MGEKVLVMQINPANRSMVDKRLPVEDVCIVDHRLKKALLVFQPVTARAETQPRMLPWPVVKPFVGWWLGDAEPMSWEHRNRDYRSEKARVTEEARDRLEETQTEAGLVEAGGIRHESVWRPVIRMVSVFGIIVGVAFLLYYFFALDAVSNVRNAIPELPPL